MRITIEVYKEGIDSLNFSVEGQRKCMKVYLPLKIGYAELIALLTSCLGIDVKELEEIIFYLPSDCGVSTEHQFSLEKFL